MKLVTKLIIPLFIFLSFVLSVSAQEQIRNFDSKIIINKDGSINVEERIAYDFGFLSKHGIYRNIPYIKTNKEGKKLKLEFSAFSVTDETGKKYQYSKSVADGKINFKIGDPDRTITGLHTYVIGYKVSGALTYFSDHDELYWNVTGNDWQVPITSYTSEVKLPVGISQSDISVVCYTGASGSTQQNCTSEIKDNNVVIKSTQGLNANEGLTFAVRFPKGVVAVLEPQPYKTFWETIFGKILIFLLILAATFWYFIYPIKIIYKWFKYGRDPSIRGVYPAQGGTRSGQVQGVVRAWFDPPKSKSGRELTSEETGAIVDEVAGQSEISGMIIALAQKGYFNIVEKKKGHFIFVKQKEFDGKDLLPYQRKFLNAIFGTAKELELKKSNLYQEITDVKKEIYDRLVEEDFFPKNPDSIRTFYTVMGVLALSTGNLFLVAVAFLFGRNMPRKTISGVTAANIAKSLRNFLSSQERQLEFQAKNQMFFEKLLPYAIVFGVEKIWADRFKDIEMKPPDWYQGYGVSSYNSTVWMRSMNSSFSSMRSAAMSPTSSSSGFGSGFSGGSSGGGGGGGGGGSW